MRLIEHDGWWWPPGADGMDHQRYLTKLRPDDMHRALQYTAGRRVAVQAGGNIGVWPKWLAGQFATVYTYEPDAENFAALCRNVDAPHVYKAQGALGDRPGTIGLTPHERNIGGHQTAGAGPIPIYQVDDLALPICDVLLLDVEGSEWPALRGAEATLQRCTPVLMLEDRNHSERIGYGTFQEMAAWLGARGYTEQARVHLDVIFTSPRVCA